MNLKIALLLALLVGLLVLPFAMRPKDSKDEVTPSPDHNAKQTRKLVIISPHAEGIRREFDRAFSNWTVKHRGHRTNIEWLDVGGTSDAIRRVLSLYSDSPNGIGVDMFFGGGVDPFIKFKKEGLLHSCTIPPEILNPIPSNISGLEVYDSDMQWFGACLGGFGIIYNKKVLQRLGLPEVATWEDLAKPEYYSWVGSGDPRSSGSVHMVYEIILQAYGWDKGWAIILAMGGNIRNFSRAASDTPKDTAMGEIACGLAIDVYALRQIAEAGEDLIGFVLPEGVTVVNPDGFAVLKGAPNAKLAEDLITFTLSPEGQKLWTFRKGTPGGPVKFNLTRLSVIPGFAEKHAKYVAVPFDAFKWKSRFVYDAQKGSLRWGILNDLIGAYIIDTHHQLATAWNKLKEHPSDSPELRHLLTMPISEDECLELANGAWNDTIERTKMRSAWSNDAKKKYLQIIKGDR